MLVRGGRGIASDFSSITRHVIYLLLNITITCVNIIDNNSLGRAIGLPNKWKHGYCKGVAINRKKQLCIYWIEAW